MNFQFSHPWWLVALPRVDFGFAAARSSSRRDVRAFVLLTFALDRNSERARAWQTLAAALARRRQMAPLESSPPAEPASLNARSDALRIEEGQALTHIEETYP